MKILAGLLSLSFFALGSFFWVSRLGNGSLDLASPLGMMRLGRENAPTTTPTPQSVKDTKLNFYSFDNLRQKEYAVSQITLGRVMAREKSYTSYLFSFKTEGRKVTGQANLPKKEGKLPVILMVRGHVESEVYFTGAGTYKAAGVFAQNGFITLAPDFLGFGGSDTTSSDILEARFEKPVTILNLLASIKTLKQADLNNIFLWGHSNGGQITLSVLEISGKSYPTALWAPVTRGFPESVLTFMGPVEKMGENERTVKERIDTFLADYDPKKYSIAEYFSNIQAPIQLHQGTADDLVPVSWSDSFVTQMESLGKKITYYKYKGNDHNLKQSWDQVVERDLEFFRKHLK